MAQDTVPDEVVIVHRPLWQRVLKWIGIAIAALAFLLLVVVFGIGLLGWAWRLYQRSKRA